MALDPNLFFYSDGTITLTNGSDIATGDLVAWDPAVLPFDFVFPNNGTSGMSVVKEVLAINQIRLAKPWTGPTLTDVPYFMVRWVRHTDPRVYALRVSDYLARLKAIPDNLEEVAADINADAAAVAAALLALQQIESNVDADRQATQTAAAEAEADRQAADTARIAAEAARDAAINGSVADNAVTNAKLADMPTARLKGRSSAGTGDPEDLTAAQARTLLGLFPASAFHASGGTEPGLTASGIGNAAEGLSLTFTATGPNALVTGSWELEQTVAGATTAFGFIRLVTSPGGTLVNTSIVRYVDLASGQPRGRSNGAISFAVTGLTPGASYKASLFHYQTNVNAGTVPRGQVLSVLNG
ncbi:hypothetical protein [Microvirga sp. BSC39]|uniref:hypothetical protein n=1 Tax=Microvirga sp. BSC39 TaxID=1549810 RepID=UPI0004E8A718|nr:hypothetical protein [Microvirga sp. BSC39]KFG68714.1 hypothetical protein JH26_14700 [Microvirga sp. BSC39]